MKTITINVNVTIQLDINSDRDELDEVQKRLDKVNDVLQLYPDELSNAQLFVNSIDKNDIISVASLFDFDLGDEVVVPDPNDDDLHQHSFVGTIKDIKDDIATVEDGDGDCWDIEIDRLTYHI